ncbi:hypothetical protein B6N60_04291 [Richelia sinica FACHB-800]|uniref:Cyanoexosortase B system-associated protein n=1 Tax=Richelia sinica FACHB-800 TaxID=1357546 RepID=A0A975TCV5_9NOST|nr:cyanoexosortase B system-associated protein [Richelia sinica]MBD2667067.1 cyanoexosortase B system-associated protein [Richelia sinica FACHB-800]QXE25571.1 hypothetical protein B6N60_04291 [Richelia sinica FACHB-800]
MIYLSKLLKERQLSQVLVLIFLIVLLGLGAFPGYITGRWQWKQPPAIAKLQELKKIRQNGLDIPGWKITDKLEPRIGEHKWLLQMMKKGQETTPVTLLVLPQNGPNDKPQIEWTDINSWGKLSWGKWDISQERDAEFNVKTTSQSGKILTTPIKARFFRVVTSQQTFAVLQWYAMPDRGNPSPVNWFFADQLAQWHRQRVAWAAVTILIPMEPLGQVETYWQATESLGQTVQSALLNIFE